MNYVEQLNSSYSKPYLFSYRRCPYAMRARMALVESKIEFDVYEISLRNKPQEMLLISSKGTVPILIFYELVFDESLKIMKWAYQSSKSNQSMSLKPEDNEVACELILINDGKFKESLDCYKYNERFPQKSKMEHRGDCCLFLEILEQRLMNMPFLMGNNRTFVDISIFPFVRQFANVDKEWFDNSKFTEVKKWLSKLTGSDLFRQIMKKPNFD